MSEFKMKINNQVLLHLRKRCLEDHGKVQREEWRTEWTKNQVQWQQNRKERKKEFVGVKTVDLSLKFTNSWDTER